MTKFHEETETIALNRASESSSPTKDRVMMNTNTTSGWRYRRFFGLPYYASPQVQLVLVAFVCFLCPGMWCAVALESTYDSGLMLTIPGMFNALNGLGAQGQLSDNSNAGDNANSALYSAFAIVGFCSGSITNRLGIKTALSFGGIGYSIYISSFLCFSHTLNSGYVIFSGLLLGCCAGVLWSAQG